MSTFSLLPQGRYCIVRDAQSGKIGLTSEFVIKGIKLPTVLDDYKIEFIAKFDPEKHQIIQEIFVVDKAIAGKQYAIIRDKHSQKFGLWFYQESKPVNVKLPMGVIKDDRQVIITFVRYGPNLPSNYEVVE